MVDTRVLDRGPHAVPSPADRITLAPLAVQHAWTGRRIIRKSASGPAPEFCNEAEMFRDGGDVRGSVIRVRVTRGDGSYADL